MTLRRDSDVVAAHGSVTRTPAPLSSSQLASLYSAEQGPDFSNYTAGTAAVWWCWSIIDSFDDAKVELLVSKL